MSYNYIVVCDGGKNKSGAYGSFKIFDADGKQLVHHFQYFGEGTSNTAEYLALINSIEFCILNDFKNVLFRTDSKLVVNQVTGVWGVSKKAKHLAKFISIARTKLKQLENSTVEKIDGSLVKEILGH